MKYFYDSIVLDTDLSEITKNGISTKLTKIDEKKYKLNNISYTINNDKSLSKETKVTDSLLIQITSELFYHI